MSSGSFQYQEPSPGWQTRWPRQAAGLLLTTPEVVLSGFLMGFIAFVVMVLMGATGFAHSEISASSARIVITLLCAYIFLPFIYMAFRMIMIRDGAAPCGFIQAWRHQFTVSVLVIFIVTVLSLFPDPSVEPSSRKASDAGFFEVVFGFGQIMLGQTFLYVMPFLGVGVPVVLAIRPPISALFKEIVSILMKSPGLYIGLIGINLMAGLMVQSLPFPFGYLVFCYWVCLMWVIAREVFGGRRENLERSLSSTFTKGRPLNV